MALIKKKTILTKRQAIKLSRQYAGRQILLAPANSKLCFGPPGIFPAPQNKLARPDGWEDFPPKSESLVYKHKEIG